MVSDQKARAGSGVVNVSAYRWFPVSGWPVESFDAFGYVASAGVFAHSPIRATIARSQ